MRIPRSPLQARELQLSQTGPIVPLEQDLLKRGELALSLLQSPQ